MALFRAIGCVIPHIRGTSLAGMGFTDNVTDAYVEQLTAIRYYPYFTVGLSTRECVTKYGYQFIEQIVEVANELGIPAECSTFHKDAVYPYKCAPALQTVGMAARMRSALASHAQCACITHARCPLTRSQLCRIPGTARVFSYAGERWLQYVAVCAIVLCPSLTLMCSTT